MDDVLAESPVSEGSSVYPFANNTLLFSHASLAELLNKAGRGKLRIDGSSVPFVFEDIVVFGVQFEPILQADIVTAANLPHHHSDPFDRILIA